MKKSKEPICGCGHSKLVHNGWHDGWDDFWETGCNFGDGECDCTFFRVDNLRYLENLSDKS